MTRLVPALFAAALMAASPAFAGGYTISFFPPNMTFPSDSATVTKSKTAILDTCVASQKGEDVCVKEAKKLSAKADK